MMTIQAPSHATRKTLSTRAMDAIEHFIKSGELRPNDRIIESELAKRLGLSRTPLREALHQLDIKGYITRGGTTGYVVVYHSPSDLKDIFEVRVALEIQAIGLACERITPKQLARASKYLKMAAEHYESLTLGFKYINLFHEELYNASGNKMLVSYIQSIRDRDRIANMGRTMMPEDGQALHGQHEEILQAVQNRDKERAEKAVRQHLAAVLDFYTRRS